MNARTRSLVFTVFSLLLGQQVEAGLLDSASPMIYGMFGQVVYRMASIQYHPGVVNTVVLCTNVDDAPAGVVLELFDRNDRPTGTLDSVEVAAGGTVTFVTSADWAEQDWVVVRGLRSLDDGKARVSATTTRLSCTGNHRIRAVDGTMQDTPLELVKKVARDARR